VWWVWWVGWGEKKTSEVGGVSQLMYVWKIKIVVTRSQERWKSAVLQASGAKQVV